MKILKRLILGATFALAASTSAHACGTMDTWIDAYYGQGVQGDSTQKQALTGILECARYHYDSREHDERLVVVLVDALYRRDTISMQDGLTWGYELSRWSQPYKYMDLLGAIFHRYGCLEHAEHHPAYTEVARTFNSPECPFEAKATDITGSWYNAKHGFRIDIESLGGGKYLIREASDASSTSYRGDVTGEFETSSNSPGYFVGKHIWGGRKMGQTKWGEWGGMTLNLRDDGTMLLRYRDSKYTGGWLYSRSQ